MGTDSGDVMLLVWWLLAIWLVIRGHKGLRQAESVEECDAGIIEQIERPPGGYSGNDYYLCRILNDSEEGKELVVSQPGYADELGETEKLFRKTQLMDWKLGSRRGISDDARFTLLWGYGLLAGAALITAFYLRALLSTHD